MTLVMPALGARKGEKRGICLLQAKRLSPAPEKKSFPNDKSVLRLKKKIKSSSISAVSKV